MSLLGAMSTVLTLGIGTAAPYVAMAVVTLCGLASVIVVRRNEHVRPLLSTGWSPLLGAVVVSSASGRVLDAFVTRYEGYAFLAVVFGGACPITAQILYFALTFLLGLPGGAGSIFVSRLSTALHAAASDITPRPGVASRGIGHSNHEPSPRLVMLVLFLVSIPVGIAFFSILRISSWLTTPFMFTVLALFFLCTAVSSCISTNCPRRLILFL